MEHCAESAGCYGEGPPSKQVQIAVMLRSDVFREKFSRKINAMPGPAELFIVVNTETAKHLADHPFRLPDLDAVLAESRSLYSAIVCGCVSPPSARGAYDAD